MSGIMINVNKVSSGEHLNRQTGAPDEELMPGNRHKTKVLDDTCNAPRFSSSCATLLAPKITVLTCGLRRHLGNQTDRKEHKVKIAMLYVHHSGYCVKDRGSRSQLHIANEHPRPKTPKHPPTPTTTTTTTTTITLKKKR